MIESDTAGRAVAIAASAVLALFLGAEPAFAHHSFASYETKVQVRLAGTVTRFQWANPHVYITLEAPDDEGVMQQWLIECANPGILNRVGWKWNMIDEGDEITAIVAPLRSGEPAALLKGLRLTDGSTYSNGGPAGAATLSFDE